MQKADETGAVDWTMDHTYKHQHRKPWLIKSADQGRMLHKRTVRLIVVNVPEGESNSTKYPRDNNVSTRSRNGTHVVEPSLSKISYFAARSHQKIQSCWRHNVHTNKQYMPTLLQTYASEKVKDSFSRNTRVPSICIRPCKKPCLHVTSKQTHAVSLRIWVANSLSCLDQPALNATRQNKRLKDSAQVQTRWNEYRRGFQILLPIRTRGNPSAAAVCNLRLRGVTFPCCCSWLRTGG